MAGRVLRCAIEQIADWHPHLFTEPHVVAFSAVASQYSDSPASFEVECASIVSKWLSKGDHFHLAVSWHRDTAEKAKRMRATMQAGPLVELASVALAFVLAKRVAPLGRLDVTEFGARADYRVKRRRIMLEVSGTEVPSEFERRHREKIEQAHANPFNWDLYVVICAFSRLGHRIRFSYHPITETADA